MTESPAANPKAAAAVPLMVLPTLKVKKMTLEEDSEACLVMFEGVATVARCPQEWRAVQLTPCLTGESHAAYRAMTADATLDYKLVKQAILQCLNISGETYRHCFRE